MVASPPRKSHSESFVHQIQGPALGTAPACGLWGFRHHGTSRLQTGTGQSGAEPSTLATPPCSCSKAPSRIAFAPLNSGSHGRVPCSPPPLPFSRALGGVPGGRGRIRPRWPACVRQTGAARLRMGGEKESARTGVADEHAGWRALAQVPACPRLSAHPRTHLAATAPNFSPVCAPLLAEFFNFLTDISV